MISVPSQASIRSAWTIRLESFWMAIWKLHWKLRLGAHGAPFGIYIADFLSEHTDRQTSEQLISFRTFGLWRSTPTSAIVDKTLSATEFRLEGWVEKFFSLKVSFGETVKITGFWAQAIRWSSIGLLSCSSFVHLGQQKSREHISELESKAQLI